MSQVGRISGGVLQDNLLRNGVDLAFENDLLYLDVVNGRIGIKNNAPIADLQTHTFGATNLISRNALEVGDLIFSGNLIDNLTSNTYINAPYAIQLDSIHTDRLKIFDNVIENDSRKVQTADLNYLEARLLDESRGIGSELSSFWREIVPGTGFERGDINNSGSINIDDVLGFVSFNRGTLNPASSQYFWIQNNIIVPYEATLENNIDFLPHGTGQTNIDADINIDGSLHANGDIIVGGNIVFGDSFQQGNDTITLNADLESDIMPYADNAVDLGRIDKRWADVYTFFTNGGSIFTEELIVKDQSLGNRQGNIFYVGQNGIDTNVGDHPHGHYKTIKAALDAADASIGGPVTIYVFPGGYEEELPLVVPPNVSIIGTDVRNVIVRPESAYQSQDIFHLTGETTIQNITVKDFYYDSGNDTGYAFRFAPNAIVTSRSPYIQNCTVITQGTSISALDPRGFASGDAGKGALIDGASVDSNSQEASMLFHSVTMITPGVDAVTMTNGVRVEWLNSFTYFANRGLYAVDGVTGHLSTDGSTLKYGAEIRSIGSANVYGNFGAVADGADTLMYLIQHNFAYIGTGKDVSNDKTLVNDTARITELNSGKIYHTSIDHEGTYRVGDVFFVNQETGETSIDATNILANNLNRLTITTGNDVTVLEPGFIDIGDFIFENNTIRTRTKDFNLKGANTNVITDKINISGNLSVDGDATVRGQLINFGNETTDTIDFQAEFDQDFYPGQSSVRSLGSPSLTWANLYANSLQIDDVKITNNYVTTSTSNSDLELRTNGSGKINIDESGGTDFTIENNLTIDGTLYSNTNTVFNNVTFNSLFDIDGNLTVNGNFDSDTMKVNSSLRLGDILIETNYMTTVNSNSNLELRTAGTGNVIFDADAEVLNNFEFQNATSLGNFTASESILTNLLELNALRIYQNNIEHMVTNGDILLQAAGTGRIYLQNLYVSEADIQTDDQADLTLDTGNKPVTINSTSSLKLPIMPDQTYTKSQGVIRFRDTINKFEGHISATGITSLGGIYDTDNDTTLLAYGSDNTLKVFTGGLAAVTFHDAGISANGLQVDDINIDFNTISTNVSNSNLQFDSGSGTGNVILEDVRINDLTFYNDEERVIADANGINPNNPLDPKNGLDTSLGQYGAFGVVAGNFIIANTDNGSTKFASTSGLVVPRGGTADRNDEPQQGELRYDTDTSFLEIYSGTQWQTTAGSSAGISAAEMEEIVNLYTLILG